MRDDLSLQYTRQMILVGPESFLQPVVGKWVLQLKFPTYTKSLLQAAVVVVNLEGLSHKQFYRTVLWFQLSAKPCKLRVFSILLIRRCCALVATTSEISDEKGWNQRGPGCNDYGSTEKDITRPSKFIKSWRSQKDTCGIICISWWYMCDGFHALHSQKSWCGNALN